MQVFPINEAELQSGIKYLDFYLKPNDPKGTGGG